MAATKNNQWWKLRASHGREKLFSSPEVLWQSCVEYFEATDKRKWNKVDFKGPLNKKVLIPTETPYTLTGLRIFLNIDNQTWINYKTKDSYKDFFEVVTRVEEIIYTQKFEGAAVGAFNPNIIARDLGLIERKDIKYDSEIKPIEFTIIKNKK